MVNLGSIAELVMVERKQKYVTLAGRVDKLSLRGTVNLLPVESRKRSGKRLVISKREVWMVDAILVAS